jgi:hypothetical protein
MTGSIVFAGCGLIVTLRTSVLRTDYLRRPPPPRPPPPLLPPPLRMLDEPRLLAALVRDPL